MLYRVKPLSVIKTIVGWHRTLLLLCYSLFVFLGGFMDDIKVRRDEVQELIRKIAYTKARAMKDGNEDLVSKCCFELKELREELLNINMELAMGNMASGRKK